MGSTQFGDLVFDGDLAIARRGNEELRFTRQERALLLALIGRPGRMLTRGQLLDALTHEGSAVSDRNIDYVISRLRAKLGDSLRAPRFIATRYGEGYVVVSEQEVRQIPLRRLDPEIKLGPSIRNAVNALRACS